MEWFCSILFWQHFIHAGFPAGAAASWTRPSPYHAGEEVHPLGNSAPIEAVFRYPQTQAGREALSRRVAGVHAAFILETIRGLNCPAAQKRELLQAVIDAVKGAAPQKPEDPKNG